MRRSPCVCCFFGCPANLHEQMLDRRLGEPRKLWILCLKVWIVKACFKQRFTCQELSLLEGRVGHIKRILPGAAAGCLSLIILTPLGSIAAVCFMPTLTWNSNCFSSCSFPLQSHFPRRMWLLWWLQHFQLSRWGGKGQGNKSSAHGSWLTFQATSKALFYTAGRKSGHLLSLTSTSLFANPGFFQDGSTNSAVLCRPQFKVTWFWECSTQKATWGLLVHQAIRRTHPYKRPFPVSMDDVIWR